MNKVSRRSFTVGTFLSAATLSAGKAIGIPAVREKGPKTIGGLGSRGNLALTSPRVDGKTIVVRSAPCLEWAQITSCIGRVNGRSILLNGKWCGTGTALCVNASWEQSPYYELTFQVAPPGRKWNDLLGPDGRYYDFGINQFESADLAALLPK